mmetsp:Transcript_28273/g.61557  ORF Transcript_28273/g.61557 Transcript_28273/m.61557 type:complete len:147 (+) Transcript_28273:105-545(+)
MSAQSRRNEHQQDFLRQAKILRKNLEEWDKKIRSNQGENWPSMLGRLNASMNQSGNLDRCIEPVLEHFVYVPKKCPANPQDVPFFLSTRLTAGDASQVADASGGSDVKGNDADLAATIEDPVKALREFESTAAEVAADFESKMIRF